MKKIYGAALVLISAGLLSANEVVYSTIPSPLPPSVVSLGYQATQTQEFGGLIGLAGGSTNLASATVAMENWAYESKWEPLSTSTGFNIPLTLNLYNVGTNNTVGSLITTVTTNAFIPWRPEPTPGSCGAGSTEYLANGTCQNGSTSLATFDLSGVSVPGQIIYGLAYNTTNWGYDPIGVSGPYESLNFGLSTDPPSVGDNPLPGTAYWNTKTASWYADSGAAGVGVFRQDQNWSPYSGAIEFTSAVPEPASVGLFCVGLFGFGLWGRRRKNRS